MKWVSRTESENSITPPNKEANETISKLIIVGVSVPVILSILGFAGNWLTSGGIIKTFESISGRGHTFEVHKFGALGRIGAVNGKDKEFTSVNSGATIAAKDIYPICIISMMGLKKTAPSSGGKTRGGTCSVFVNEQSSWEIEVTDDALCKVMCLK